MIYYEDKYFYYFRKLWGLASTWWKQDCFLNELVKWGKTSMGQPVFALLNDMFDQEQEYGLVNRLDNDTSGLLYFAKNPLFKSQYKQLQQEHKIQKYYLVDVEGKPHDIHTKITTPLAHHKHLQDRMVAVRDSSSPKYSNKIRWELISVETDIGFLSYDKLKNISTLKATISKGCRHQIRCHLASIWCPIVWDNIYNKKQNKDLVRTFQKNVPLNLRSVGFATL